MYIVKVLKRKDAASLIVAIVVGLAVAQMLPAVTFHLANKIVGSDLPYGGSGASTTDLYLQPLISATLQLILLEILIRLYVGIHGLLAKKK